MPTVFAVQSPNDDPLMFELRDRQGAVFGEIQTPDGDIVFLDPTTISVVRGARGATRVVFSDVPGPVALRRCCERRPCRARRASFRNDR